MSWYSSDCTPFSFTEIHIETMGQSRVEHNGKASAEFLIHRLFMLDWRCARCTFVTDPQRSCDKTAHDSMYVVLPKSPHVGASVADGRLACVGRGMVQLAIWPVRFVFQAVRGFFSPAARPKIEISDVDHFCWVHPPRCRESVEMCLRCCGQPKAGFSASWCSFVPDGCENVRSGRFVDIRGPWLWCGITEVKGMALLYGVQIRFDVAVGQLQVACACVNTPDLLQNVEVCTLVCVAFCTILGPEMDGIGRLLHARNCGLARVGSYSLVQLHIFTIRFVALLLAGVRVDGLSCEVCERAAKLDFLSVAADDSWTHELMYCRLHPLSRSNH